MQLLLNWRRWGIVRVFDSGFPKQDSFEWIPNDIPCVNSYPLFLHTLYFEFRIWNENCSPNSQQDNIIIFILTFHINTYLYQYTSSLLNKYAHYLGPAPFLCVKKIIRRDYKHTMISHENLCFWTTISSQFAKWPSYGLHLHWCSIITILLNL